MRLVWTYIVAEATLRFMYSLCKIWGFHRSDYEEWLLIGHKIPVRTSKETHYVSVTKRSRLMLCKIWDFHGSDYEECLLLGQEIPVCTSQETHYVSATKTSRLMLCKIWDFRGGNYEKCRLLWYKHPVHTSQETHHVSAIEPSRLMLWSSRSILIKTITSYLDLILHHHLHRSPLRSARVDPSGSATFEMYPGSVFCQGV
jgi:hypothetical protein